VSSKFDEVLKMASAKPAVIAECLNCKMFFSVDEVGIWWGWFTLWEVFGTITPWLQE